MSRTTFTKHSALTNSAETITKTSITSGLTGTNGFELTDCAKDDKLVFVVENTGSATGPLTIYSGAMNAENQGNINVDVGGSVVRAVGPVEGARVKQSDGSIYLGAGFTGTIYAVEV
jgi:hypothetical protein